MQYRTLGRSGLKVSTITLGTMTFGGKEKFAQVGQTNVKEARTIIDVCIEHGVNLIDTANIYSAGLAEEIIGEALNGTRPGDVLIATKARFPVGQGPNDAGFSRYHLIREVERSLKRLRTDVIDIYYMHQWDGTTPLEEMLETLDTLIKQGKIRYIGCSNFSGWHVMKALGISNEHNFQRFVTQQIHYTIEAREAEYELLPLAVDQGLGVLVWSPIAGGLLSGKYTRNKKTIDGTRVSQGWTEPPIRDEERLWNIVDVLTAIGSKYSVSAAQVALAWLLTRPAVTSLVIGGRTIEQIKDNIAATNLTLTAQDLDQLNKVSILPLLYPYWHQFNFTKERFGDGDRALYNSYLK